MKIEPRKDLNCIAENLWLIEQHSNDPFDKIKALGNMVGEIQRAKPSRGCDPIDILYDMLETYAQGRLKQVFLELADYYELNLWED
jgi:hypothetical protein